MEILVHVADWELDLEVSGKKVENVVKKNENPLSDTSLNQQGPKNM